MQVAVLWVPSGQVGTRERGVRHATEQLATYCNNVSERCQVWCFGEKPYLTRSGNRFGMVTEVAITVVSKAVGSYEEVLK